MPVPIPGNTATSNVTGTNVQAGTSGGNQTGSTENQQQATSTQQQSQTGGQNQANVYLPWQSALQQVAGNAAGNYVTSGAPPPGVTGADQALQNAYISQYNQEVAPQIAAAQGPGSAQLGSQLALGLERLNADVYGTNLAAYQNAINQAGTLGFNAVGVGGTQQQTSTGTTGQRSTSNTQQQQDWQQAMTDLLHIAQDSTTTGFSTI